MEQVPKALLLKVTQNKIRYDVFLLALPHIHLLDLFIYSRVYPRPPRSDMLTAVLLLAPCWHLLQ